MPNNEVKIPIGDAHSVMIENRNKVTVSGVIDVTSFDEHEIMMETTRGMMTIVGEEIKIERLSLDVGELTLEGDIDSVAYAEDKGPKVGFWSKLF